MAEVTFPQTVFIGSVSFPDMCNAPTSNYGVYRIHLPLGSHVLPSTANPNRQSCVFFGLRSIGFVM